MKIKSRKNIETPEVFYELAVDFGGDGTMTVFSHTDLNVVENVLDKLMTGDCSAVDIDEDELKDVTGISIYQTIEAPTESVNIATFGEKQEVMVELCAITLDKEV